MPAMCDHPSPDVQSNAIHALGDLGKFIWIINLFNSFDEKSIKNSYNSSSGCLYQANIREKLYLEVDKWVSV